MDQSTPPPLTTFSLFPNLPIEVRLMIWEFSLPGPRIVHLKQKLLKQPPGRWWERVRSDVSVVMEESEREFKGGNDGDNLKDIEKLERDFQIASEQLERAEGEHNQYDGAALFDDLGEVGRLETEYGNENALHDLESSDEELADDGDDAASEGTTDDGLEGVERPKELSGFMSETPIPSMLLACRESRDVALRIYQPCFSALGARAQIYFNPDQDTLFIDHESFICEYADLSFLIEESLSSSDLDRVQMLAVESMGCYLDGVGEDAEEYANTIRMPSIQLTRTKRINVTKTSQAGTPVPARNSLGLAVRTIHVSPVMMHSEHLSGRSSSPNKDWLVDAAVQFRSVTNIIVVSDHITYGTQTRAGQKYIDLKDMDFSQKGEEKYEQPKPCTNTSHHPHGTFFLNGLRISRSFIDWDRLIDRYWIGEGDMRWFWRKWKQDNPELNLKGVRSEFQVLIPAADEKMLLNDAALFEKANNKGRWVSYYEYWTGRCSKKVPACFFI